MDNTIEAETQNSTIYSLYKRLRNKIRDLNAKESLCVIWAYTNYMQFTNHPFPSDVQVDPSFLQAQSAPERRIYEWELEVIAREIILEADSVTSRKSLKEWNVLIGVINELKDLENEIGKHYFNADNVLTEMSRIAHRQFPWQMQKPSSRIIIRYFKIFNTPDISAIAQSVIGLDIRQIYFLHTALLGAYLNHSTINLPLEISIYGFTKEQANKFTREFALPFTEMREKMKSAQQYNDRFSYNSRVLYENPIILFEEEGKETAVCPLPTLLFWRASGGLYYRLVGETGFDKAFGAAYEKYVGDVLKRAITKKELKIFSPLVYRSPLHPREDKETIDWRIDSLDSVLFIECKAKRMPYNAKFSLETQHFTQEIEKTANIIVQLYKAISDYRSGYYPDSTYAADKKIYPLIVSLEDWYLFQGSARQFALVDSVLHTLVKEKLEAAGIPPDWTEEMPYQICSIAEFEEMAQYIDQVGVKEFMEPKVSDEDKRRWQFGSYSGKQFPEESKNVIALFEDDFEKLFAAYTNKPTQ